MKKKPKSEATFQPINMRAAWVRKQPKSEGNRLESRESVQLCVFRVDPGGYPRIGVDLARTAQSPMTAMGLVSLLFDLRMNGRPIAAGKYGLCADLVDGQATAVYIVPGAQARGAASGGEGQEAGGCEKGSEAW